MLRSTSWTVVVVYQLQSIISASIQHSSGVVSISVRIRSTSCLTVPCLVMLKAPYRITLVN